VAVLRAADRVKDRAKPTGLDPIGVARHDTDGQGPPD
jgi:hypothetical protein